MNDILEYIDGIETSTLAAESSVIGAMASLYEKEAIIMECCLSMGSEWYQEGIMDTVKQKEAGDSNKVISALKLIPRILMALASSIANAIKKSKIGQSISIAIKKAQGLKDKEAKEAYCDELNAKSNGEYTAYVNNKGEICFLKGTSALINDVFAIITIIENVHKAKDIVGRITGTTKNSTAALKELNDMTDLMASVCKPEGSKTKNSEYASTNIMLQKTGVKMAMLEGLTGDADGLVGTIKNISGAFTEFLDSEAYRLQLKGMNDTTRATVTKTAANITNNLTLVLSAVSGGLGSVRKLVKVISSVEAKKADKKRKMSLYTAQRVMQTFYKDPEHRDDPEKGLTRAGLESLYPISKGEPLDSYNARIDSIIYDIGDAFVALSNKDKDRDPRLVDQAYELDDELVALRRKPSENKNVFITFTLKAIDKDGKEISYPANSYVPYAVAARNIGKIDAKNKKDEKSILNNADSGNQAAINQTNSAMVRKELTRREKLSDAVAMDNAKRKNKKS